MEAKYFKNKDRSPWLSTVLVSGSSETAKNFEFCKGRELFWIGCVTICLPELNMEYCSSSHVVYGHFMLPAYVYL
jgi:hypothetical protein